MGPPILFALSACASGYPDGPPRADTAEIAALAEGLVELGAGVDPSEAARASRVAYDYTRQLAILYEITDPPIVHNRKVNRGDRPRGLCWHWAEDMEARLKRENFVTLDVHRAIANADNPFRLEHSTAVLSARGDTVMDGIVVDPWRLGGALTWERVADDTRYKWRPRAEVHAKKRARRLAQAKTP